MLEIITILSQIEGGNRAIRRAGHPEIVIVRRAERMGRRYKANKRAWQNWAEIRAELDIESKLAKSRGIDTLPDFSPMDCAVKPIKEASNIGHNQKFCGVKGCYISPYSTGQADSTDLAVENEAFFQAVKAGMNAAQRDGIGKASLDAMHDSGTLSNDLPVNPASCLSIDRAEMPFRSVREVEEIE